MATVRQNTLITKKNDDDTYKVYSTNSRVSPGTAPATAVRSEYAPKPVQSTIRDEYAPKPVTAPSASYSASSYGSTESYGPAYDTGTYNRDRFQTSDLTNSYLSRLQELEDERPGDYSSIYNSKINDALDAILNRKAFDIKDNANYQMLYDQAAERYTQNAKRAMNDTLASANAATGGYGSTYAGTVAQQAYDQQMEGLNDRNIDLMNLAYRMYGDDVADNYNRLNALNNLDAIDYGRYRDSVGDYYNDLNYNANRYDASYGRDYQNYADYENAMQNQFNADRNFAQNQQQYENSFYESQYQNALNTATELSKKGLPVPSYVTDIINRYVGMNGFEADPSFASQLQSIAAQATSGSGKSTGAKSSGEKEKSGESDSDWTYVNGVGWIPDDKLKDYVNSGKIYVAGKDENGDPVYMQGTDKNQYSTNNSYTSSSSDDPWYTDRGSYGEYIKPDDSSEDWPMLWDEYKKRKGLA